MNQFFTFIKKKQNLPITFILLIALVLEVWYSLQPISVWWDTAIYVNMGKYLFTQGTLGVWEYFRPPVLPIIYGIAWKLGFNTLIFGKVLAITLSLATVFVTYLLGEKVKEKAGVYAALSLAFLPTFFAFATVPLSDIPSTFFSVLAVYLIIKNKYAFAGMSIALAFLLRFPQVLIIAPIILALLLSSTNYKQNIKNSFKIILAFFLTTLPYFIINFWLYRDPFLPIIGGNQVAIASGSLTLETHSYFYYFTNTFTQNPAIIFSLVFLFIFIIQYKKLTESSKKSHLLIIFCFAVLAGYFSYIAHKELRYSIAFLPFLFIATGYGITYLLEKIKNNFYQNLAYIASLLIIFLILMNACYVAYSTYLTPFKANQAQRDYYTYFADKPGTSIMTTSPQMGIYSDVKITELGDTWEHLQEGYDRQKAYITYVAYDTCNTSCDGPEAICKAAQDSFLKAIELETTVVFSNEAGYCKYKILKLK